MSIKGIWSEFKAFAFKGNMIDLAVAVVIGAAFSGVINGLVADIIMPGVIYVVTAAKKGTDVVTTTAEKAASAVGVTSQPSTEPSTQPTAAPATQATTEPTTMPVVALAAGPGSAPPELLEQIGALQDQVKQLKDDAAKAAAAAAKPAEPKAVEFKWMLGPFAIGHFIGEIINFLLIAAAVFFVIVKLLGSVMKKVGGTPAPSEPTTKECPLCLSVIPIRAKKCPHCTADLPVPA